MNTHQESIKDASAAANIRSQYIENKATKLDELKDLDSKVKAPGMIIASVIGTIGVLVMGTGMSNVMVWDNMLLGLCLGIPGMVVALLAYPIYKGITNSRKKEYTAKILELSKDIIGEKQ